MYQRCQEPPSPDKCSRCDCYWQPCLAKSVCQMFTVARKPVWHLWRVAKACELVHSHLRHPVHNVGAEGTRYDPTYETHTHMADD
jgi:hypothetical protein